MGWSETVSDMAAPGDALVADTLGREPFHSKLLLYPTLKCPIQCRHCAIWSGPQRREEMPAQLLESCVRDIVSCKNVDVVVFSGGEPFFVREKIRDSISTLRASGIAVSVQTSAYWAKSPATARRILQELPSITQLIISVDEFHQEFVPFRNVANACLACADLDVAIRIHTLAYEMEQVEATLKQLTPPAVASRIQVCCNRTIHLVGRGCDLRNHPSIVHEEAFPDRACFSCSVAFVLPDGKVAACGGDMQWNGQICEDFELGSLANNSLLEITAAAQNNYLVHAMRLWGPKRLAEIALAHGVADLRTSYIREDVCDLCCDIFSNAQAVHAIRRELDKPEFRREVALARALCFGELNML